MIESQIETYIYNLEVYHWFAIFGLSLISLEALVGGVMEDNIIVLAASTLTTGVIGTLFQIDSLLLLTVILGISGSIIFYIYHNYTFFGLEDAEQTSDANSLLGKEGVVESKITRDDGEVKLDGGGFSPYYSAVPADGGVICS